MSLPLLRMPGRRAACAAGTAFLLLSAGCGGGGGSPPAPAASRPQAPDFTLSNLAGTNVSLSQYRGRPVLVDFWATWCPPCRLSIPALQALYLEYKDRGLEILGVSVDDGAEPVRAFVRDAGLTYPVLLAGSSDVADRYGVQGIPALYLLDKEGRVVRRWIGYDPRLQKEWRDELDSLLAS